MSNWRWSNSSMPRPGRSVARWVLWMPILMVGSMVYWTLALGLGGLSLMAASALSVVPPPAASEVQVLPANDGFQSITVHLEESAEPEDVNDNAGAGGYTVVPAEDTQAESPPGPGNTSY